MTTGGRCYSRAYAQKKGETWCERARAWADVQSRQYEARSMSCARRAKGSVKLRSPMDNRYDVSSVP